MADANTPAWMQDNTVEVPAPEPSSGPIVVSPPPPPTLSNGGGAASSSESGGNDADLPGIILTMRLANMGVAVALIVVSVRQSYGLLETGKGTEVCSEASWDMT